MLNPEIKRFRLGLWTTCPNDGRSLSRLLGPFNEMQRREPRLEVIHANRTMDNSGWDLDWHWFSALDAAYFLDPYTDLDLQRVATARATGCKVWVDYIDDLFNVPPSNPAWMHYADGDAVRTNVARIVERANVVSCTTETLKRSMLSAGPEAGAPVVIIPESCRWPQCPLPRKRCVSWRGLASHFEDMETVLDDLRFVSHLPQFSKWEWVFFGEPPWKIFGVIPKDNLIVVPFQSPYQWMNAWGGMAPFLHIVPMADNAFNRAKSSLAWLEASAIGAAVIGPNLPEWQNCNGLIRYQQGAGAEPGAPAATFGEVLRREMQTFNGQFHPKAIESRQDIYPAKTLNVVNHLRWEVINALAVAAPPAIAPNGAERVLTDAAEQEGREDEVCESEVGK
jgi:hypothetical protein